jgi:hypothetical protein
MAEMSNYLEDNLLDHVLRGDTGGTSFPQPLTVYLALHTANPTDAGSGAEVSGGSYARKLLAFGAASSGTSTNTGTATYTNMPTATVTHAALWDAVSGGNLLFHTSISTIAFNSGDEATVAAGAITVSMD